MKITNKHGIGKIAELEVASRLIALNIAPFVSLVDTGTDIMTESGFRIQVRGAGLQVYNERVHEGRVKAYHFGLRSYRTVAKGKRGMRRRDWSKHCDFFVLWCSNENRFFVVPQTFVADVADVWIRQKGDHKPIVDVEQARQMFSEGKTYADIALAFNVSHPTAVRAVRRGISRASDMTRTILQFEDAWHLLDTNAIAEKIVESVEVKV